MESIVELFDLVKMSFILIYNIIKNNEPGSSTSQGLGLYGEPQKPTFQMLVIL